MDVNPGSPTFGQFRWVDAGVDTTLCPMPAVPIYGNAMIERLVFRNNCGAGFVGGSVIFRVPAGAYSSYIDQADADAKAEAYFVTASQNFANANGACISNSIQNGGGEAS